MRKGQRVGAARDGDRLAVGRIGDAEAVARRHVWHRRRRWR